MVWGIQWLLLTVLLPASGMYVLLQLVNSLSREEMLGKMAGIAEYSSFLGAKITSCSSGGAADHPESGGTGHGLSKKRASVKSGRSTSGSGKCSEHGYRTGCDKCGSGQKLSGSCDSCSVCSDRAGPMLHYGILSLLYRLLAAVAQPVSDQRMVRALGTMGEGCALLLRILFTAEVLCMLAFLVLMAGIQR